MRQEPIDRAIDACYDALVAPETWPTALQGLARSVDAVGAIVYAEADPALPTIPVPPDLLGLFDAFIREGWWRTDYRGERAFPLLRKGRAAS